MKEIRNVNGVLVAKVDESTGVIEIVRKGCITQFKLNPDGKIEVTNKKTA